MSEKALMKGNEAVAEAAIHAGCRHFFGYPITPQTELAAYMARRLPKIGGVFLQAESEIAAINMVLGAAAAGVRALTSSSSPGISLKSEGLSYLAGCDLPAVIVNVQRGGPGLGGIQPSQADYFQATRAAGHGDFHMLVLAPDSVQAMYSLALRAFALADKYRMTVMLLADGILGQMMEPVVLGGENAELPQKPWAVGGTRTGRGQNVVNSLYLKPDLLEQKNRERYERYRIVAERESLCDTYLTEDADIVVAAYGSTARVARNAITAARAKGIRAGLLCPVTLWPFPRAVFADTAKRVKTFVCTEMSMGQMAEDVLLSIRHSRPVYFHGRSGGMVPAPEDILHTIERADRGEGETL